MPASEIARIGLTSKITRDELIAMLDRILELNGCTDCGFGGYDLHLTRINPVDEGFKRGAFRDLEGIASVNVTGR